MGDQRFISKWEKRRTTGLFKYSLLCSVGITGAGFFSAIIGTIAGHGDLDRSFMRSSTIYGVAFLFVVGLGVGVRDWNKNERKYKLLIDNRE